MLQKKDSSLISLALLVAFATASTPVVMSLVGAPVLAQSATPTRFPSPSAVPQGTTVQIDGSNSMAAVNQALAQRFQQDYPGTQVNAQYSGSTTAIQSLVDGKVDLAAIGRLLTPEERAQGVKTAEVVLRKIAVIVGADNPFAESLTNEQFAQIFRGEITNWSEVGGPNLPIRFIDRPLESDTRQALRNYPVFRTAPFESGQTAVKLTEDSTAAVIQALGKDGIGYAIVDQVTDQAGIRIVPLHSVLPSDPRYSFSQPLAYAYTEKATPGALAFLGHATAPAQQAVIASAQIAPAAIAALATAATPTAAVASPAAPPPSPETPVSSPLAPEVSPTPAVTPRSDSGLPAWLWWLLPLGLIAGFLGWLLRRRPAEAPIASMPPEAPPAVVPRPEPPLVEPPRSQAPHDAVAPRAIEPDPWIEANAAPDVTGIGTAALAAGAGIVAGSALADDPLTAEPGAIEVAPDRPVPADLPPELLPTEAIRSTVIEPNELIEPDLVIDEVAAVDLMADATPNPALTAPSLGGAALATGAAVWAAAPTHEPSQVAVEATKFDLGRSSLTDGSLADVDAGLSELPNGYGESQIILLPRDPQWAYAYWDAPNEHRAALRQQGGQRLALRVYDVTAIDLNLQSPHSLQQYDIEELAREWFVAIPVSDRDYVAEIGYLTDDGRWLMLARSTAIRVPPVYPSDTIDAQMLTINWEEDLQGKTFFEFTAPNGTPQGDQKENDLLTAAHAAEAMRIAGSLYGSMQQVPASIPPGSAQLIPGSGQMMSGQALSSFAPASGIGMSGIGMSGVGMSGVSLMSGMGLGWQMSGVGMSGVGMSGMGLGWQMSGVGSSGIGMSGIGMSGVGMSGLSMMSGMGLGWQMSGVGMMSGIGMSGVGMSGVGMSGIGMMPDMRSRKFWLLADAELIVYGATEPTATVTIDGRPVQLNPDGTFRFQMAFPDGQIDFPIMAIAIDGEQTRYVRLTFDRETPLRRTNSREDAVEEQL